jgi:lysophospholipase L1-like esterase
MRRSTLGVLSVCSAVSLLAFGSTGDAPATTAEANWVASWTASPTDSATPADAAGFAVPQGFDSQTVRMIVTPHLGGTTMRIHLSNRFSSVPLTIDQATVGLAQPHSVQNLTPITFDGNENTTIAAGQDIVSDPVTLTFSAFAPLAISLYLPNSSAPPTKHWNANATSYYSLPLSGNLAGSASDLGFPAVTEAWFYVDEIDVTAPAPTHAIVAFGDSITDGFVASSLVSLPVTTTVADKNGRYPDDLQRRIDTAGSPVSIVNAGISANQLLTNGEPLFSGPSGLQRFQTDALDVTGTDGVLLLEGINDLGLSGRTAGDLITGLTQAVSMAHAAGKKIWLGTIMPASNALFDGVLLAPESETYREQVNAWIRSQDLADGVVDFDAALRDPANPTVLNPAYAGPDNLHPNLVGYQAMANAVNLAMLTAN